jgi:hypothetical protein
MLFLQQFNNLAALSRATRVAVATLSQLSATHRNPHGVKVAGYTNDPGAAKLWRPFPGPADNLPDPRLNGEPMNKAIADSLG